MKRDLFKRCPDQEALITAYLGEARGPEKDALARHVLHCPRCRLRLDILRHVHREFEAKIDALTDGTDGEASLADLREVAKARMKELRFWRARPARRRFWGIPVPVFTAGVFTLLVMASAAAVMISRGYLGHRVLREGSPVHIRLIEPIGKVSRAPESFRWQPVIGAKSYTLTLIDEDLNTIFSGTSRYVAQIVVPLTLRNRLERGSVYVWEVKALDDSSALLSTAKGSFAIR